jgi:hypothetical protein
MEIYTGENYARQYICIVKGKGKVVPVLFLTEHHAMKAY